MIDMTADWGRKVPFRWVDLHYPNEGFGPRNVRGQIKVTVEVLPRTLGQKCPASKGRAEPEPMDEPERPPEPANPIFNAPQCAAYIKYTIKEALIQRKSCICCCCCALVFVILVGGLFLLRQSGLVPI